MIRLTAWLVVANAGQLVLSFAQAILLSRWLGVARWGALGRILALVTIADSVAQGGMERILTREVAACPERDGRLLGAALKARLALTGLVGLALWAGQGFWATLLLGSTVGQLGVAVLSAKMLKVPQVAARLLGGAVTVAAILGCIALATPGVTPALGALALAGLARSFMQIWMAKTRLVQKSLESGRPSGLVVDLLRLSWPLWLTGAVMATASRLDVILLGRLFEPDIADRWIGYYQVAYRLVEGGNVVLGALALAAFPLFSSLRLAPYGELRRAFFRATRYALFLGGGGMLAVWLVGGTGVRILFGADFAPAIPALLLLAPILAVNLLNSLLALLLTAVNRTWTVLWISAGMLIFNGGANLLVIPAHGFVGAAAVKTVTELVGLGLFVWCARNILGRGRPRRAC